MQNKAGINEKNRKRLDALNRCGKNLFSIEEAAEIIDVPIKETRLYLSYLARRGWLARVKRGLYISVPLGIDNPHEYKENPWLVADRIFSPYYIGGWSATEHWGLTDQIFNSVFVFTSRPFRHKNIVVQGSNFALKFSNEGVFKHTKGVWIDNVKIRISDPVQTIVDVLDDPATGGGIRHVADIIENYFTSEYKEEAKLLDYIKEKGNKTIYKRLGFILERLNISSGVVVAVCRENISRGYSAFDPKIRNKGIYSRRWNLRVNAEIR
ncbi:MAG: type IV toxin-antitoxin system AbiEi family antitoxin domain-containing protein [Candidatus Anammoxibacter sp.]